MAERYLGTGIGAVILTRLGTGQYTGVVNATLFPVDLGGPGHELFISKEVTLSLEYTDQPNGMIGIAGVIIRFEEVLR